jgi:MinD superfamily P-loop ATPase
MRIKVHKENCTGCRLCQQICTINRFGEINPKKASIAVVGHFPEPGTFEPKLCTQCGICAKKCPQEAIHKEGDAYVIHEDECTNCGVCIEVCPFDVIFTHPDVPIPIMCNLCMKCTEVCNTGALEPVE